MERCFKLMLIPWLVMCWLVSGAAHAAGAPCLPKVQWPPAVVTGAVTQDINVRYDTYAVWVCNLPAGYAVTAWLFKFSDVAPAILKYANGALTKAAADADCATTCVPATATEQTFLDSLTAANKPPARVAFNGANPNRSVYAANADGSLNATAIRGSSVAVAAPCNSAWRIPGTSYYSVLGSADASKPGTTLGTVFAVCVVSLPLGAN